MFCLCRKQLVRGNLSKPYFTIEELKCLKSPVCKIATAINFLYMTLKSYNSAFLALQSCSDSELLSYQISMLFVQIAQLFKAVRYQLLLWEMRMNLSRAHLELYTFL